MEKHIFTPIWKCDKIEAELKNLRKDGWELKKISGFRKFSFIKSEPKDATYFFTFSITKGATMIQTEDVLTRQYNASEIDGHFLEGFKTTSIYCIDSTADLLERKVYRNRFLSRFLVQNALIGFLFLVFSILAIVLSSQIFEKSVFLFAICACSLLVVLYNLFGWLHLRKQYKKYFQN